MAQKHVIGFSSRNKDHQKEHEFLYSLNTEARNILMHYLLFKAGKLCNWEIPPSGVYGIINVLENAIGQIPAGSIQTVETKSESTVVPSETKQEEEDDDDRNELKRISMLAARNGKTPVENEE